MLTLIFFGITDFFDAIFDTISEVVVPWLREVVWPFIVGIFT
jgi:hypothetical protein